MASTKEGKTPAACAQCKSDERTSIVGNKKLKKRWRRTDEDELPAAARGPLVLRDRGSWRVIPKEADAAEPKKPEAPTEDAVGVDRRCSRCCTSGEVAPILSDCNEGLVCERCFAIYHECPVCPRRPHTAACLDACASAASPTMSTTTTTTAGCWLRLVRWTPDYLFRKHRPPPFVPVTAATAAAAAEAGEDAHGKCCPLMPPHVPARVVFRWQCPVTRLVFDSRTDKTLAPVEWRENVRCHGCKQLAMCGSAQDGYRCFNAASNRCGGTCFMRLGPDGQPAKFVAERKRTPLLRRRARPRKRRRWRKQEQQRQLQ